MDLGISGRRALVAGSSSGIGAGIALALAKEGVDIIVHGRNKESAQAVCDAIAAARGTASIVLASLDDPAEVGRLAHEALASGPVDILINCAGAASEPHRWFDGPADAWQRQFQTSTFYAVQLIQAIVPSMRERGWGRVLNVSSGAAYRAMLNHPEYAAAKLALHSMTATLSAELGDSGVNVNTLVSGPVLTPNTQASIDKSAAAQGFTETGAALEKRVIAEVWRATIPLARMTEPVFENLLVRFHDMLTLEQKAGTMPALHGGSKASAPPVRSSQSNRVLRHVPMWRVSPEEAANISEFYISARQAADIYEASTFMIQQYGTTFNACILIDHDCLGIRKDRDAIGLVSSLSRELALRWADWSPAGSKSTERGPHRICFHERREDGSLLSQIILHVPIEFEGSVRRWLNGFFGRLPEFATHTEAVAIDIQPLINPRGRMARHWDLLRGAWGGLSTEWRMEGHALVDLLKVPSRTRRKVGKIAGRRYNLSQSIGEQAQRAAKASGSPFASILRG